MTTFHSFSAAGPWKISASAQSKANQGNEEYFEAQFRCQSLLNHIQHTLCPGYSQGLHLKKKRGVYQGYLFLALLILFLFIVQDLPLQQLRWSCYQSMTINDT